VKPDTSTPNSPRSSAGQINKAQPRRQLSTDGPRALPPMTWLQAVAAICSRTLAAMESESQATMSRESAASLSFAVEAFVGHGVSGWPFGQFEVSTRELRVGFTFP
jgi:hypothetical protein